MWLFRSSPRLGEWIRRKSQARCRQVWCNKLAQEGYSPFQPRSASFCRFLIKILIHSSHRWTRFVWHRSDPRLRRNPQQLDWWILRYCFMGSKGCWPHNVSFCPYLFSALIYLTGSFSPGLINCFNSLDEYNKFWNGTLVYPEIDIKYGFSEPSDLAYFNSQVSVMDERWKALGEICLKHETGQYLPYVGTTATVRDLVAIAEYFDGKGCDINYYGMSYGTIIGNYLINSESPVPQFPTQILNPFPQCSPIVSAGSSWMAWGIHSLTPPDLPTSPGAILLSLSTRPFRVSPRDAPSLAPADAASPPILPQDKVSLNGPKTCSLYACSFVVARNPTYTPDRSPTIIPNPPEITDTSLST